MQIVLTVPRRHVHFNFYTCHKALFPWHNSQLFYENKLTRFSLNSQVLRMEASEVICQSAQVVLEIELDNVVKALPDEEFSLFFSINT